MQVFGLISLLITIAVMAWWFVGIGPATESPDINDSSEAVQKNSYKDAIDSAKDAAESLGGSVSLSSKSIFIHDEITVPEDIRVVDLSGKNLSGSLKAEVRHLTNLRELDISNNDFTGLPAEVGQLAKLEILNLSNNPLTGLPYELGNLSNLKVLDLRGTQYSSFDLSVIKQGLSNQTEILID